MTELPELKIKKMFEDAIVPMRAYPTDSGLDLYVYSFEKIYMPGSTEPVIPEKDLDSITLPSGGRLMAHTGISATVGTGYEIQIRPRSGLALKNGLTVLNTPGTIDEAYRGAICVIIINHSGVDQIISKDMKIAQMVVCPIILSTTIIVEDLNETLRSSGGFGSTGV